MPKTSRKKRVDYKVRKRRPSQEVLELKLGDGSDRRTVEKPIIIKVGNNDESKNAREQVIRGDVVQVKRIQSMIRIIDSMNLDEMIEASEAANRCLCGEIVPVVKSPNAQIYVKKIVSLNKRKATKDRAVRLFEQLNNHIVSLNYSMSNNRIEARKLYAQLMNNDSQE